MHNCVSPPSPKNKKRSEPAGFKRPPRSLLRQRPIQDKLPGCEEEEGVQKKEVNFNENIHESGGGEDGITHT